jgi:DNA repair protein RecN (Recombination protein N)
VKRGGLEPNEDQGSWISKAFRKVGLGFAPEPRTGEDAATNAARSRRLRLALDWVMLSRLSIRDIVLIERLDIDYAAGLVRADRRDRCRQVDPARCLRAGARQPRRCEPGAQRAEQGQVTAAFDVAAAHPALALLAENGIATDDGLILRRVQLADGRTRAFVNDQPVSVQVLKASAPRWWKSMASTTTARWSMSPRTASCSMPMRALNGCHRRVARLDRAARCRGSAWQHRARVEQARREADYLRHAVEELRGSSPRPARRPRSPTSAPA